VGKGNDGDDSKGVSGLTRVNESDANGNIGRKWPVATQRGDAAQTES